MRNGSILGFVAVLVGCSGSTASVFDGPAPDPSWTAPAPSPQAVPGGGLATYQKSCGATAALPGILASSSLSFSVHYPSTWNNATTQPDQPRLASYSSVGTPKVEERGDVTANRYYLGDPTQDPKAYLRQTASRANGEWRELTIGGHPAASWWERYSPPQPGCAGCGGDPGPDIVAIHVAVALGGREILELTGTARVTAFAQVFCDIQAIEASLATTR
jgi:hypothetical protein